jgi:hypothetical protein
MLSLSDSGNKELSILGRDALRLVHFSLVIRAVISRTARKPSLPREPKIGEDAQGLKAHGPNRCALFLMQGDGERLAQRTRWSRCRENVLIQPEPAKKSLESGSDELIAGSKFC